ncbi:MAG: hypothetical protein M0024_12585 [Nitrospiraceae bacterium]|nr:hypothetical protein [Nitrospiraceae bacterium]
MNIRPIGWSIVLYAFSNSYYGVASIRNVLGRGGFSAFELSMALLYGICWCMYFIAGFFLIRGRDGRILTLAAASGSFLSAVSAVFLYSRFPPDFGSFTAYVLLARPLPDLLIAAAAYGPANPKAWGAAADASVRLEGKAASPVAVPFRPVKWPVVLGLALPWLSGLLIHRSALRLYEVMFLGTGKGLMVAVFMTFWFSLPYAVLQLLVYSHTPAVMTHPLRGGMAGVIAGSLIVFSLMWQPGFNTFMLPVSPPFVYAGGVLGYSVVLLAERAFSSNT